MVQSETVERILDAAEQLFSQRGFAETSLRLITAQAGVNLAAVNYHFGSKKALIQAVFVRLLGPLSQGLEEELQRRQVAAARPLLLEELLELLVVQALELRQRLGRDLSSLMRLLGFAFSDGEDHLRLYLARMYGRVFRRYMGLVHQTVPTLPREELFWRMQFMLGAAIFSLSGLGDAAPPAGSPARARLSCEQMTELLVPFMAAGMRAESVLHSARRCALEQG